MRRKAWRPLILGVRSFLSSEEMLCNNRRSRSLLPDYVGNLWFPNKKEEEKEMEKRDMKRIEEVCHLPGDEGEKERRTEMVESYLVEVVGCLMDVRMALGGAQLGASVEKGDLVRVGRDFGYQQGIIDVCDEIAKYASGEVNLQDAINSLLEAKKQSMEQTQQPKGIGMEVV